MVLDRLGQLRLVQPLGQVEHPDRPVAPAGRQRLAVGRDRQAQHRVVHVEQVLHQHLRVVHAVEDFRRAARPGVELLLLPLGRARRQADVVDAHVPLLTGAPAGDDQFAVREERQAVGALGPGADAPHQFAGGDLPDGQLVVPADDHVAVVRGERQGVDDDGERVRLRRRRRLPPDAQLLDQVGLRVEAGVELGALLDPPRDDGGLILGYGLALVARRHAARLSGDEQGVELTLLRLSVGDRVAVGAAGADLLVAGHVVLAGPLLGVVAGEAVLLEDRGHVVDETDPSRGRLSRRRRGGPDQDQAGGGGRTGPARPLVRWVGEHERHSAT